MDKSKKRDPSVSSQTSKKSGKSSKSSNKSSKTKKKKFRKTRKVTPETPLQTLAQPQPLQENPTDSDNVSISQFRNEKFLKQVEKQLQQDKVIPIPSLKVHKVKEKTVKQSPLEGVQPEASSETVATTRFDAVAMAVVLAQLLGCVAIAFEAYAYNLDQIWNQVVEGKLKMDEIEGHTVFKDRTFDLSNHEYLLKTKEHMMRKEYQEMVFIVYIVIFIGMSSIQLWTCYVRFVNFEQFSVLLITMYAVGGAFCILSTTFLVSAATNIENNYMYAADMLYNFQHMYDDQPPNPNVTCKDVEYLKGCESYEFARARASQLEQIFRVCGDGSRYTRYYRNNKPTVQFVSVDGEVYFRRDLKELGFCSRDGFKYAAALFAILMGIICSIVPVVYCCEGRAVYREPPSTIDEEVKKLPKPEGRFVNKKVAIYEFKAYVEKQSDEELKHANDHPVEVFQF